MDKIGPPIFAQLTLLPNHQILRFTMLLNRPDTPKAAPLRGGICTPI